MIHLNIQGTKVPALGFGTWDLRGKDCSEGVSHALTLGYRHIDTAQGYDNEQEVGEALRRAQVPRDDIFLVTKVKPEHFRRNALLRSSRQSLRDLQTDYVDLLLLHWPNPDVELEESLEAMLELKEEGAIRALGVSNFPPSLVARARQTASIFSNQVEYHPFLSQDKLRAQAQALDYMLTAYCPIARGRVINESAIQAIAETHGKTPVQVTLRWLIQQDKVAAIPKAASPEHRESNIDIFDFELSETEMAQIHDLAREERLVDPEGGPAWERS